MKKPVVFLLAASLTVLLTGCQNPDGTQNYTGTGALIGGFMGALTGAAVGGDEHGGQDALIGAAVGALTGGLVGNSMDREQAARLRAEAPQTYEKVSQCQPLTIADVKALAKAGISQDIIINQIKSSHTIFHLTSRQIISLRDAGVPDHVINYMINTPSLVANASPSVVVQQAPPPPPPVQTTVVIRSAPNPDMVWIHGEWVWNDGWFWVDGHWAHRPYQHAYWVPARHWHDYDGWHERRGCWR